jgi:hypothetical protein
MEKQSENETKSTVESTGPADAALGEKELDEVSAGTPVKTISWSHDDESPKETVTFEYGN